MWKRELICNKIYAVLMVLASLPVVILEKDGTVLLLSLFFGVPMSDRKNAEGYSDPTAYQAMMNLEIEELRFKKLLRSIKDVCDLADFEIEGRVVLIDKRSGRVWR